jgi:hypothetical protein
MSLPTMTNNMKTDGVQTLDLTDTSFWEPATNPKTATIDPSYQFWFQNRTNAYIL